MGTDSATDLKPIDAAKVKAIASRLASDHDGEVVAAARALIRIAAAAGKRVEDLFAVPAAADYLNKPFGRGWPKTGPAMSKDRAAAAYAFARAAEFTAWAHYAERYRKPNWKFIVDGLCLVGKAGLLNVHDVAVVNLCRRRIEDDKTWTPPAKFDAHILELARRHGIVAE